MIPLMRAANGDWKGVVGVMGSQMGKTDSIANIMGARLDDSPVPMIYTAPTRNFVERTWEPRFMEMVDSSTSLSGKITRGKTASKTQKTIAGVKVSFAWAGSATSVAGEPAGVVVVDERDRMGSDVEGEGDPVALANARHSTYADGKTFVFSTPLIGTLDVYIHPETGLEHWEVGDHEEVLSPTWRLWQRGTRHEWMWPCPHCEEFFAPRFMHLRWPEGIDPNDIDSSNLRMACPHCGGEIEESQKIALNDRGQDIAPGERFVNGERVGSPPRTEWYSLWVSGFCSPWRSWVSNAREYAQAEADGDSESLQTVVNTRFGELFSVSGEVPTWEEVAALRLDYPSGTVPDGVSHVLLTVDVQKDRLVYVIRGWSRRRRMESWLIEHGEIPGDTLDQATWDELGEFRLRTFTIGDSGHEIRIQRCFVDQKYRAPEVFAFCKAHKNWAFPAVGRLPKKVTSEAQKPLAVAQIEIDKKGQIVKAKHGGLTRYTLNTDLFKRWVHDRISLGDKSNFHLSADADEDYCKQLVAEARIEKKNGTVMWLQLGENHYLDCEMMQIGCAYSLRLQNYAQPRGAQRSEEGEAHEQEAETPRPPPRRRIAQPRTGWRSTTW